MLVLLFRYKIDALRLGNFLPDTVALAIPKAISPGYRNGSSPRKRIRRQFDVLFLRHFAVYYSLGVLERRV